MIEYLWRTHVLSNQEWFVCYVVLRISLEFIRNCASVIHVWISVKPLAI